MLYLSKGKRSHDWSFAGYQLAKQPNTPHALFHYGSVSKEGGKKREGGSRGGGVRIQRTIIQIEGEAGEVERVERAVKWWAEERTMRGGKKRARKKCFFHLVSFQEDSCSVNWKSKEQAQPRLHDYHHPWIESQSKEKKEKNKRKGSRLWKIKEMRGVEGRDERGGEEDEGGGEHLHISEGKTCSSDSCKALFNSQIVRKEWAFYSRFESSFQPQWQIQPQSHWLAQRTLVLQNVKLLHKLCFTFWVLKKKKRNSPSSYPPTKKLKPI